MTRQTPESIAAFTALAPGAYRVAFTSTRDAWSLPVVGMALSPNVDNSQEREWAMWPVVLDDETGRPLSLLHYLADRHPRVAWRMEPIP